MIDQARENRPVGGAICSMAGVCVTSIQRWGCPSGGNSSSRWLHGCAPVSSTPLQTVLWCSALTATNALPAAAGEHTPSTAGPSSSTAASQNAGTSGDATPLLQNVRLQAAAPFSAPRSKQTSG